MKQVLLLFSDDFPEHEEVVHNFASYLDHRCGCDVSLELWQPCTEPNQINWIIGEIRKAHSIIIIASEGAYKKHEARMQNVSRKQLLSRVTPTYSTSMYSELLSFFVAINIRFLLFVHLYSSGLLHWHHGNRIIVAVSANLLWFIGHSQWKRTLQCSVISSWHKHTHNDPWFG